MQTLTVKSNGTILLPHSLFKPRDKIAFIREGDTLILKRLNPPKVSDIAKKAPGKSFSLKEIAKEIHLFRKHKAV